MARFFKFSGTWQALLDKAMDTTISASKAKKLKDAWSTHWIQQIDSHIVFLELIPAVNKIMTSPTYFTDLGNCNWDGETVAKANGFLYQMESSSFLVSFIILLEILSNLRDPNANSRWELHAHREVKRVITTFEKIRRNSEQEFRRMHRQAAKLGQDLNGREFAHQGLAKGKCIVLTQIHSPLQSYLFHRIPFSYNKWSATEVSR